MLGAANESMGGDAGLVAFAAAGTTIEVGDRAGAGVMSIVPVRPVPTADGAAKGQASTSQSSLVLSSRFLFIVGQFVADGKVI